jgi:hypothetical protein
MSNTYPPAKISPLRSLRTGASLIAGVTRMPAPTRAKEPAIETLSLEERVRLRAYDLYVERGNESGSELDDWLQAEEEIRRAEEESLDEH